MRLHNIIGIKKRRVGLRHHLTPAEAVLWNQLKNSKLGVKFRRQHSIGPYILDFYCPSHKLAVELDGSPHDTEVGYAKDQIRDRYIFQQGIKTIRFENYVVLTSLEGVLTEIKKYL